MFFKIAKNNVKKSFKDYWIYFLTLTFAVCIFYTFNSISSQEAFKEMNSQGTEVTDLISNLINIISVFIAFVLGGLILYANNFLIKRRKKELGIYETLGMSKGKISKILVIEEIIIGVFSLIVGLIIGVFLSQGLSILTIELFDASLDKYNFIFSNSAMIKTTIYFSIIFIVVMIFNVIVISRYKLIDLIYSSKKNEKMKVKNPIIAGIIFIISLGIIGFAYHLVIKSKLNIEGLEFKLSIVLGVIGTILFFYSLTGFLILIIKRIKGIYFKGLNLFTVNQINSKVNTNFLSMAIICLMIFFTTSVLAVGVAFKNQNVDAYLPLDDSISFINYKDDSIIPTKKVLDENKFTFPEGTEIEELNEYRVKNDLINVMLKNAEGKEKDILNQLINEKDLVGHYTDVVTISDYNNFRKLLGKEKVELKNNEVILVSTNNTIKESLKKTAKEKTEFDLDGQKVRVVKYEDAVLKNTGVSSVSIDIVIPDNMKVKKTLIENVININYGSMTDNENKEFQRKFETLRYNLSKENIGYLISNNKAITLDSMKLTTTLILYIGLYIGAVFLVSSAAVLALQQLSEASDSFDRYESLRRIGTPEKLINKSIFRQTFIYFMLPLGLAIIHSMVGIYVANDFISLFGKASIYKMAAFTMAIIILIYIGYFIVTYLSYKNIVKKK